MTANLILEKLCNLPVDYHRIGTASAVSLIQQSGFLQNPAVLSRNAIAAYLRDNPTLVEQWEVWSDDQRYSPAWVFVKGDGAYTVYRHPVGEQMIFADKFEACAEFIVRQILAIARVARKKSY